MIRKGNVTDLKELMKKSTELGMQTFDQALFDLYSRGEITYEDALSHADSQNDLRLMIKLSQDNDPDDMGTLGGFSIQEEDKSSGRTF
jgi:twitching motility protein PilU